MEEKTVTSLFEDMKSDVTSYVTNSAGILKLEVFEKLSKGAATTSYLVVLLYFVFLALGLALFTLGFYLGEVLGSLWKGFGVVALGAVFITLLMLLLKKTIKCTITNSVVKFLQHTEDEEVKYSTKN